MQHISYNERKMIERMLLIDKSFRYIGNKVSRDHTVVMKEVKKNLSLSHPVYNADRAQLMYEKRLKNKKRQKLQENEKLRKYVIDQLREDWSPDEISKRLEKFEYRKIGETISHETIYKFVYSKEGRDLGLTKCLRTGRNKRRTWYKRSSNKTGISERVSIHKRPKEANNREEIGHFETDLMEFERGLKGCMSVDYDRKSRACSIKKLDDKKAISKLVSLKETINKFSKYGVKTFTFDNGSENVKHTELRKQGIDTYFCDPYCSLQKGGVENTNKLCRQYFPRWMNPKDITDEFVQKVENKLNNRPRKVLGYFTPNEILLGGAINT